MARRPPFDTVPHVNRAAVFQTMKSPGGTVCVVEDDHDVRESLCALFDAHGVAVQGFASAAALLAAGDLQQFACFVVDHRMPGMSGLELVEHLRARGIAAPAVIVTSLSGEIARERVTRAGVSAVLPKPGDAATLMRLVLPAVRMPPR